MPKHFSTASQISTYLFHKVFRAISFVRFHTRWSFYFLEGICPRNETLQNRNTYFVTGNVWIARSLSIGKKEEQREITKEKTVKNEVEAISWLQNTLPHVTHLNSSLRKGKKKEKEINRVLCRVFRDGKQRIGMHLGLVHRWMHSVIYSQTRLHKLKRIFILHPDFWKNKTTNEILE